MPPAQNSSVRTIVSSSRRIAPEMRSTRSPTARSPARSRRERGEREQRHERLAHDARAQQAEQQHDQSRRRAARAAATAPPSRSSGRSSAATSARAGWPAASWAARDRGRSTARSPLLERQLRVQRQREDQPARAARARAPSATRHLARLDRRPDAVVHRADEHPQHVDARHARRPRRRRSRSRSSSWKTPSRIRNSPTKFDEPGIASVAERDDQEQRREHRRAERDRRPCRAGPPSRRRARPAAPTMKNAGATTRPWLTDCRIAPCAPCVVRARRCRA